MYYSVRYTLNPPIRSYAITDREETFFNDLSSQLTKEENRKIKLMRTTNGSITVRYDGYVVGKVKLRGRKCQMEIVKNLHESETVEGSPDELQARIPEWISLIRTVLA